MSKLKTLSPEELRSKVIKGLEAHANPKVCITCAGDECPYYNDDASHTAMTCSTVLAADALSVMRAERGAEGEDDASTP